MPLPLEDKNVDEEDAGGHIKGNLPPDVKGMLESVMREVMARPNVFGASVGARVFITEASIVPKVEESSRTEARVVCEVTVAEGSFRSVLKPKKKAVIYGDSELEMLNPEGSLHGGCAAFLIDAYVIIISPPSPPLVLTRGFPPQVHYARVPRRRARRWCFGIHERCLPRPRRPVRTKT
jgi:hypothetical protein